MAVWIGRNGDGQLSGTRKSALSDTLASVAEPDEIESIMEINVN